MLSGLAVAVGCVLFLGGFAWGAVVYQPYTVPDRLDDADRSTRATGCWRSAIDGGEVRRGDVVVFTGHELGRHAHGQAGRRRRRRQGRLLRQDGKLTVNGKPIEEPYLPKGSRPR